MDIPDYDWREERKKTLHLSLPEDLVKQVREVAYRKRRHISHLCRFLIEAGLEKLAAEDEVTAEAVASVGKLDGPGGLDHRTAGSQGRMRPVRDNAPGWKEPGPE